MFHDVSSVAGVIGHGSPDVADAWFYARNLRLCGDGKGDD